MHSTLSFGHCLCPIQLVPSSGLYEYRRQVQRRQTFQPSRYQLYVGCAISTININDASHSPRLLYNLLNLRNHHRYHYCISVLIIDSQFCLSFYRTLPPRLPRSPRTHSRTLAQVQLRSVAQPQSLIPRWKLIVHLPTVLQSVFSQTRNSLSSLDSSATQVSSPVSKLVDEMEAHKFTFAELQGATPTLFQSQAQPSGSESSATAAAVGSSGIGLVSGSVWCLIT